MPSPALDFPVRHYRLVPGYAAQVPSPKAAVALIEKASGMMGTPAPTGGLNADIDDYDARIEALISDDDILVITSSNLNRLSTTSMTMKIRVVQSTSPNQMISSTRSNSSFRRDNEN